MQPRITFGVIVLNGEPFTRYNLRALYPFAHEIIVVEGASPHSAHAATPDGHSIDGTLELLRRFKAEEDPENKIVIVTAEDEGHPNGFWPGEKDEQSRAYAKRATGDWLWQVDIDEFYQPDDMRRIVEMLATKPGIATISVPQFQFWGGLDYISDGWYLRHRGGGEVHRIFRWGPGYSYASHRPVTILDEAGVDLRQRGWVRSRTLARQGLRMYHYSMVFPFQAGVKSNYYSSVFGRTSEWAERYFLRLGDPYRVLNVPEYPSWLERHKGTHPPAVQAMWAAVRAGEHGPIELRRTDDVEALLASPRYRFGRAWLKIYGNLFYGVRNTALGAFRALPAGARGYIKRVLPAMARAGS